MVEEELAVGEVGVAGVLVVVVVAVGVQAGAEVVAPLPAGKNCCIMIVCEYEGLCCGKC